MLQDSNKSLLSKIKAFDDKVNAEVHSLANKIVPKKKFISPKFDEI